MNDTQAQLDSHEKECAIRYQNVQDKLEMMDKRLWRLEALIMGSTILMIGLAISIFVNVK
jgi:hypothetical protein